MKPLLYLLFLRFCVACDHDKPQVIDPWSTTRVDSAAFRTTHHYWKGDHFVTTDSLRLSAAVPGRVGSIFLRDSTHLGAEEPLVVVNIDSVADGRSDSLWVMVAGSAESLGWVSESELLQRSVPDNVISRCIHTFSSGRMQVILCCLGVALLFFFIQRLRHTRFQMVHFNDIKSVYPTLLCIVVSGSAVLYGALQQFAPDVWEEFYFHPTLNIFAPLSSPMRLFVMSCWLMLIVGVAVVDDLRKQPGVVNAVSYLSALAGVCLLLYFFFTQAVHFYIGYPLLFLYWAYALRRHFYHNAARYRCGACGNALHKVGRCPYCGALNE